MFGEKFKLMLKGENEKNNKKQIENLLFFIVILIVVVIVINKVWTREDDNKINNKDNRVLAEVINSNTDELNKNSTSYYNLQGELEKILETIEGVGKVKVLINYSETSSVVAMYNETTTESSTQEKDTQGGTRNITEVDTQKEIAYSENNGTSAPITEKVIMPTIEGAIVTAQGASNATVKTNIVTAVEAVTGLPTHKIQVFKMESSK